MMRGAKTPVKITTTYRIARLRFIAFRRRARSSATTSTGWPISASFLSRFNCLICQNTIIMLTMAITQTRAIVADDNFSFSSNIVIHMHPDRT